MEGSLLSSAWGLNQRVMLYRTIRKTGINCRSWASGACACPPRTGGSTKPRAIGQIRYAIDQGVNYVDTAWPYHAGESETLLGKALRDGYRDRVKVATKLPSWMIKSRADMDRFLAAQLEKLGTDHIDYYLLHALDGTSWDKLAALGVARIPRPGQEGRAHRQCRLFLPRTGRGFPAHRGRLSLGLLPDPVQLPGPEQPGRHRGPAIRRRERPGGDRHGTAARRQSGVARRRPPCGDLARSRSPRTPAEWALRWVWNHPEVTVVLSGMNEEAHIEENLAIAATARANAPDRRRTATSSSGSARTIAN